MYSTPKKLMYQRKYMLYKIPFKYKYVQSLTKIK
jgi:hypothetical protein